MSVLTIAVVGGAISAGFYYMNRETATSQRKLKESTAMVFVLSCAVLLVARFFGLGDSGGDGTGGAATKSAPPKAGGALAPVRAVPFDYVICGEPPF